MKAIIEIRRILLFALILACAIISVSAHAGTFSNDENNIDSMDLSAGSINSDKNGGSSFGTFGIQARRTENSRTGQLTLSIIGVTGDTPWKSVIDNPNKVFSANERDFSFPSSSKESTIFIDPTFVPIPVAVWILGATLFGLIWIRRQFLTNK